MNMEYVLGIDIGTGSVKAVAVNLQLKPIEASQQHYPFNVPKPGYHEQDAEQIYRAFITCIKDIVTKTGKAPAAICLSCAMHSLIVIDKNCTPLAPMTTWADSRSAEIAKQLKNSSEGIAIYKTTGTPIHAMSPLCKLVWMRENDQELFNSAYKFISIKEYIWYKLFGEYKIDHSVASGTGLFDIHKLAWHPASLEMAGITAAKLAEPVHTGYLKIAGQEPDFLAGVKFVIGASDGCMANLGNMARAGVAVMTIGTSGAVRITSNKPLINESAMTFNYILDDETFICGGPINNGGLALQWWLKNIMESAEKENDYVRYFKQIADIKAGSNGLFFLPYLTGERAPVWDSESSGSFFGVKLVHTQAHFSKAVLEGICYAMKNVLDAVQQNSEPITQINVGGGFVQSAIWVQTLADVIGIKMVVTQNEDASAMGAVFMAMKNTGLISEYPVKIPDDSKVFYPDTNNTAIYSRNFQIYKQLYPDLKETMHQLYKISV